MKSGLSGSMLPKMLIASSSIMAAYFVTIDCKDCQLKSNSNMNGQNLRLLTFKVEKNCERKLYQV